VTAASRFHSSRLLRLPSNSGLLMAFRRLFLL